MENDIKKLCCLYVSDWHLSVMLLPYINKQINEDVEITTIFKNDLEKNMKLLVEKLNLKNSEKILNLDYGKKEKIDYIEIDNILNKIINKKEIIIVVNGEKEEIEQINIYIEEYLNKNDIQNKNIKIINCYEVVDIRSSMDDIILKYETILNTTGEKAVSDLLA